MRENADQNKSEYRHFLRSVYVSNFTEKGLPYGCFSNDFVKLSRTALTDCISSLTSAKKWLHGLQNKLIPGKQIHDVHNKWRDDSRFIIVNSEQDTAC